MIGMRMGQTDEVNLSIRNQLINRWPLTDRGRISIDYTKTTVGKSDQNSFANPRFKKINRQFSFRSVGGLHYGVR